MATYSYAVTSGLKLYRKKIWKKKLEIDCAVNIFENLMKN